MSGGENKWYSVLFPLINMKPNNDWAVVGGMSLTIGEYAYSQKLWALRSRKSGQKNHWDLGGCVTLEKGTSS